MQWEGIPQAGTKQWCHLIAKAGVGAGSFGSSTKQESSGKQLGPEEHQAKPHAPPLAAPGPHLTNSRATWDAPRISQTLRTRATPPPALPKDARLPKKQGPHPPSFLPRTPWYLHFCTRCSSRDAGGALSPSVPSKIRAFGHPHPRCRRSAGRDRPAPQVWWGGNAWETQALEPAWSLAAAWQTHQLEDVLILGHDGELQHIVTAGRRDGGVRPVGVGPNLPSARPVSLSRIPHEMNIPIPT